MKTHNLVQGSPEWLAYRLEHDNASEAAAMMGLSKTTTRTELMHARHTGLGKEFCDWVQRNVLDHGHEVEANVRPLVEAMIGEELYPVTCSDGRLSASLDGLTMSEEVSFECKQWNIEIAAQVADGVIPEQHMPQCQQILMVTGAQKLIFAVGDGTPENLLAMDVFPDPAWFDRIQAGWKQFHADLVSYVPTAPTVQAVAAAVESLPAVRVQVGGQLAVSSNLPEFAVALRAFIERIPAKPSTDQEFADCEAACKSLKKAEDALESSETHALAQMTDVESMRRMVADLRNLARTTRLASEKTVAARKESIRLEIVQEGIAAIGQHITALNTRLGKPYMPAVPADFAGAVKGRRTVDSLRDAVSTTLANAKISASATADKIQLNLSTLRMLAKDHTFLFADTAQIVLKEPEDLSMLVTSRITAHKAAEEKKETEQRERIRAEEQEKAEKSSRVAKEAEDALVLSFEKEARRIEFDSVPYIEKASRAYESTAMDWEHDPRPRIAAAYAAGRAYLKDRLESAKVREEAAAKALPDKQALDAITSAQATPVPAPVTAQPMSATVTVRQVVQPIRPAATAVPTLTLGMIGARLGFNLSADFLKNLGFEAAKVKAACLYQEADFPLICMRLVSHIQRVLPFSK